MSDSAISAYSDTFSYDGNNPQYTTFGQGATFVPITYDNLSAVAAAANNTLMEIKKRWENNGTISSERSSGYQKTLGNYFNEYQRLDDSRAEFLCKCLLSLCCFLIGLPIYLIYYYYFSSRAKIISAIKAADKLLPEPKSDDSRSVSVYV